MRGTSVWCLLALVWLAVGAPIRPALALNIGVAAVTRAQCGPDDDPVLGLVGIVESESNSTQRLNCSFNQGTSSAYARLEGNGMVSAGASGIGPTSQAQVYLGLSVHSTGTPPIDPGNALGIEIEQSWQIRLTGASGGAAVSDLLIPNGDGTFRSFHLLARSVGHADGDPQFLENDSYKRTEVLLVGVVYAFVEVANCSVGTPPNHPGTCGVYFDPVFSFDQAAFDAKWGDQSFPLADYYEIALSENFGAPVPEPATASLMLLGLCGLALSRRHALR